MNCLFESKGVFVQILIFVCFRKVAGKKKFSRVRGGWVTLYKVKMVEKDEGRGFLPCTGQTGADPGCVRQALTDV